MKRRTFITLIGGAAAWSRAARAQQRAMPLIGILGAPAAAPLQAQIAAFHAGLKETGYIEGQHTRCEYRWAEGHYDRLPAMAEDLVRLGAAVIVALAPAAASAAKAATSSVPIVFVIGADPVTLGLVRSLNRPEGNSTGISFLINALGAKRLELVRELLPTLSVVGLFGHSRDLSRIDELREVAIAARV